MRTLAVVSSIVLASWVQGQQPAWSPPKTSIPKEYVAAFQALVGHGVADPRGGVPSRVAINLSEGQARLKGGKVATGWVLPGGKRAVLITGIEVDILRVDRKLGRTESIFGQPEPDELFVSTATRLYGAAALPGLLLMRGEVAEAERIFAELKLFPIPDALVNHVFDANRFQFVQAISRRDDVAAVRWAEAMVRSAEVGTSYLDSRDSPRRGQSPDECRALLRDTQRRVAERKDRPIIDSLRALPMPQKIKALVEALDEVVAHQWSQPGGVDWIQSPIVVELIDVGQAAIPALLDVIEKDQRYTRSYAYHRDFFPMRYPMPVRSVALEVIERLMPTAVTLSPSHPYHLEELRRMWARVEDKSVAEQWLMLLADDRVDYFKWHLAAQRLTQPEYRRDARGNLMPQAGGPMLGESIRATHGGEFERLIWKRVGSLMPAEGASATPESNRQLEYALLLLNQVGTWRIESLGEKAAEATRRALEHGGAHEPGFQMEPLADLITLRLKAGDRRAAQDYAQWAQQARSGDGVLNFVKVAAANPADPLVQEVCRTLLARTVEELRTNPSQISVSLMLELTRADERAMNFKMVRTALNELIWIDHVIAEGEVTPDGLEIRGANFQTRMERSRLRGPMRVGKFPITLGDLAATSIRGSTFHPALEDRSRTAARLALSSRLMGD